MGSRLVILLAADDSPFIPHGFTQPEADALNILPLLVRNGRYHADAPAPEFLGMRRQAVTHYRCPQPASPSPSPPPREAPGRELACAIR